MSCINDLIEKKAKAIAAYKAIQDKAEKESRNMNADERQQWDRAVNEVEDCEKEIEMRAKAADIDSRNGRKVAVEETEVRNDKRNTKEYRKAYDSYLRYGSEYMGVDEKRALVEASGSGTAGGYLVSTEYNNAIREKVMQYNPIRQLCEVMQVTSPLTQIPLETTVGGAIYVGEGAAITDGATGSENPVFGQASLGSFGMKKVIVVSRELVNDNIIDLNSYIARNLGRAFGEREYKSCLVGPGTTEPKGIIPSIVSGNTVTTASASAITVDEVLQFTDTMPNQYQPGSVIFVNQSTRKTLRQLKDAPGRYLWIDGLAGTQPNTLNGFPVFTCSYIDAIAGAKVVAAMVNLKHFVIADRGPREIQVLVETYAGTGQIGYLGWQRIDTALLDTDAAAALKMHA